MVAQAAATQQPLQDETIQSADNESKGDKFVRLAEPRVEKALTAIRRVGNLGARSLYEYQDEDVEAIVGTLSQALADMESRFRERPRQQEFRLRR